MRNALTILSLGLLIAACSGGTTSSGTTGASSTGTSSGTTGGGTTGTSKLAPGAVCSSDMACASGVCGPDGSGKCCTAKCSTTSQSCGATACDDTGACTYPAAGIDCGSSCSQGAATQQTCDGKGACMPGTLEPCVGNFVCNQDAGLCNHSCESILDCAPNYVCNAHKCVGIANAGLSCTENDDCISGICGITGSGMCCANGCNAGTGAPCGATGCDDAGACVFPDAGEACGTATASCTGNTAMGGSVCDGVGNCGKPVSTDCTPYICGANACLTACSDGTSCGAGDFCDVENSACCGGLKPNGAIAVDTVLGNDAVGCCGLGSNPPCRTITKAMASIDAAQAAHVTITAKVSGGGGDWSSALETYPIVLGWGAELSAPGVFFSDPGGSNGEIFDIKAVSSADALASASIYGTPTKSVGIGMSSTGTQLTDLSAIQVESGGTLYLANASVNGSSTNHYAALTVAAGGTLTLGQDFNNASTGTVYIGNGIDKAASDGWIGILCESDDQTMTGCNVNDVSIPGNSVVFQGQEGYDIEAEDFASISLTSAPIIGLAPPGPGFGKCGTAKPDGSGMGLGSGEAVLLHGLATMAFDNGIVQCIGASGFGLTASQNGGPTLTMDKTTIQNTETAIDAAAGTVIVSRSTIEFNYNGVVQSGTASVNLSGGKIGGANNIVCSSKKESVDAFALNPGVCVLNQSGNAVNASNVEWDTPGPDVFTCGALTPSGCSCAITTCTDSAGADGMDAVNQDLGTITTTDNGTSAISCG